MNSLLIKSGEIIEIDRNRRQVLLQFPIVTDTRGEQQVLLWIEILPNTQIMNEYGGTYQFEDLRVGFTVDVTVSPNFIRSTPPRTMAEEINVLSSMNDAVIENYIIDIDRENQWICLGNKEVLTNIVCLLVNSNTKLYNNKNEEIPFEQLHIGQFIRATHARFFSLSSPPRSIANEINILLPMD